MCHTKRYKTLFLQSARRVLEFLGIAASIEDALMDLKDHMSTEEVREIIQWAISETILVPDFEEQSLTREEYNPLYDRRIRLFEEVAPGTARFNEGLLLRIMQPSHSNVFKKSILL